MNKVNLIEVFSSWQGEGPDSCRPMLILRFKRCSRSCIWCDTKVKMRISQETEYSIDQIQKVLDKTHAGTLITGGEPTFTPNYDQTLTLLKDLTYPISNVETNGFNLQQLVLDTYDIRQAGKNIKFMFSPKIFNEKDLQEAIQLSINLFKETSVYFKVVYEYNELIEEYLKYITTETNITKQHRLYLMPEGITRADLLRNAPKVFDAAEKYKCCFSSRTHIMYEFI
jgi:organic radical activating enzyme